MIKLSPKIQKTSGEFPILNEVYYVSNDPTIIHHNNTTIEGSFGKIIQDLDDTQATIVLTTGNYNLQGNTIIITNNITLMCLQGALLQNGTLEIDGTLEAGDYQIYDTDFYTTYNKPAIVNPIHYGVIVEDESASINNTTIMTRMLVGLFGGSMCKFSPVNIWLDETWCIDNATRVLELGLE